MLWQLSVAGVALTLLAGRRDLNPPPLKGLESCDVRGIYNAVDTPPGSLSLNRFGDPEEVEQLLVPTKLDDGVYDVSVTRKGKDLYRVDGTSSFVATRYCYEYAYSQKAVLRYRGVGTRGAGSLIFDR